MQICVCTYVYVYIYIYDANLAGPRTDWAARGNRAVTPQGLPGVGWVALALVTARTGAGAGDTLAWPSLCASARGARGQAMGTSVGV